MISIQRPIERCNDQPLTTKTMKYLLKILLEIDEQ